MTRGGGPPGPAMDATPLDVLFVVGPTASGKTRLAVALARRFAGEIVSADSRQVYRGMDLGTGKDLAEYAAGEAGPAVPLHLVDVVEPWEEYHLFRYLAAARAALAEVAGRCRLPVVAGGTGLYLKALLDGYRLDGSGPAPALRRELEARPDAELLATLQREAPDLAARVDRSQHRRLVRAVEIARTRLGEPAAPAPPVVRPLLLGVFWPRAELHRRIEARLDARLAAGLLDEVRRLHAAGVSWERLESLGLEYRFCSRFLQGQLSAEAMRRDLLTGIRHLCRRQDIWFRRFEREGRVIHWLPGGDVEAAAALVHAFLSGRPLPPPAVRLSETFYGPLSVHPRVGAG